MDVDVEPMPPRLVTLIETAKSFNYSLEALFFDLAVSCQLESNQ